MGVKVDPKDTPVWGCDFIKGSLHKLKRFIKLEAGEVRGLDNGAGAPVSAEGATGTMPSPWQQSQGVQPGNLITDSSPSSYPS
jgi:hypothetical protein